MPNVTITTGTPTPSGGPGGGTGTGSGDSTDTGSSNALNTMVGTSWGAEAAAEAQAMGLNASALAAVCQIESGCQNLGVQSGSTVSGPFQMTDSTYLADIQEAAAQNPSLSIDTSRAGKSYPANQAIAAGQDLKNAVDSLQSVGISNPTFLDTRGYFNFGAAVGPAIAQASDSKNMAEILSTYYTPAQMLANGVTASTTVGLWRQSVISKVGSAASQSVLNS